MTFLNEEIATTKVNRKCTFQLSTTDLRYTRKSFIN